MSPGHGARDGAGFCGSFNLIDLLPRRISGREVRSASTRSMMTTDWPGVSLK
jgi:hypothetical protein